MENGFDYLLLKFMLMLGINFNPFCIVQCSAVYSWKTFSYMYF